MTSLFEEAEQASRRAIVAELEAVNAEARASTDRADVMEKLRDTNLKARLGFALQRSPADLHTPHQPCRRQSKPNLNLYQPKPCESKQNLHRKGIPKNVKIC